MKISPLNPADEAAALELMSACFDGESNEYFRGYYDLLAAGRPDLRLAAKVEGRLVGYLEGSWVEHYFGDQVLPAANIGALCTHPEFRRRGIARRLIEAALAEIDFERHPITGLHAAEPAVYAPHGFLPVPHSEMVAAVPDRAPPPARGILFEAVAGDDFDELFDLYRSENRRLLGPLVRSRRYFNGQHDWMTTLPREITWETMRQIGRSVGYLRYRAQAEQLRVLEVVASGRERGRAAAARLIQAARAAGVAEIRGRVSPQAPFVSALGDLTEMEVRPGQGLMFRINNLDGLLKAIGPHLSLRRRTFAVTSPPVNLDIEGQVRSLSFPSAQAVFGTAIEGAATVSLTQGQFLALVFGCAGSAEALDGPGLRIDSRAQLGAVFPEDGWVLWEADHF